MQEISVKITVNPKNYLIKDKIEILIKILIRAIIATALIMEYWSIKETQDFQNKIKENFKKKFMIKKNKNNNNWLFIQT